MSSDRAIGPKEREREKRQRQRGSERERVRPNQTESDRVRASQATSGGLRRVGPCPVASLSPRYVKAELLAGHCAPACNVGKRLARDEPHCAVLPFA